MSKFSEEKLWREELSVGRGISHFPVAKGGTQSCPQRLVGVRKVAETYFRKVKHPRQAGDRRVRELLTYHGRGPPRVRGAKSDTESPKVLAERSTSVNGATDDGWLGRWQRMK